MNGNQTADLKLLPAEHRLLLLAVTTMIVTVLVYHDTFSSMVSMWSLITYQHGWLVFPVSLYLLWRKRASLAVQRFEGSWLGLAATAVLVVVWVVSRSIGVQVVEFICATLMIFSAFWAIAGTSATRTAAFPLLLLLLAVPVGEFLVQPLMTVTAAISSALLTLSGVAVFREGQFFILPGGMFEVADYCSGLRYLLAGVVGGLAYAYLTYTSNWKRLLFTMIVALAMVATNGIRAFIVMYVASATEMRVLGGVDHVWFGMILFAIVFVALIWFGEAYADLEFSQVQALAPSVECKVFSVAAAVLVLLLIIGGPVFQYAKVKHLPPGMLELTPPSIPGCAELPVQAGALAPDYPDFHGADFVLRNAYDCEGQGLSMYIAGYVNQAQGKELISSGNRIWNYDWRRFTDLETRKIQTDLGPVDLREVWVHDERQPALIWYWYQVGDVVTHSELQVKLIEARSALRFKAVESSVVAVTVSGEKTGDLQRLRTLVEPHAQAVMRWNLDRVAHQP